ncbi:RDD family protein [Streptomyces sp. WAC 06738]|uniref:RDD family protein n=1 Tax=Streptomyces sp. WAC 06738 TaxID=2203210 RepID=UPI001F0C06F4|nr:RDD family protein [Streptomyces sp. WAC 06738]
MAPPPTPTTPELPQPRPAQPQLAPQGGHAAPPLTPAARTAPPPTPQQPPAAQLPERPAARAELPQGGGGSEPPVVPWRPPSGDPFLSAAQGTAPPAGLGRRLGARFVDALLVGGVLAAVAVPLVSKSVDHVQDKIDAAEESGKTVTVWLIDGTTGPYLALVLGLFLVLGLVVEALPTAKWGRTPGKRLFGVRVLDIESQDPPATGSALRRWLTYAVFLLLPFIGLLNVVWCAFDKPWRQCWHDKAGRTYVARG